MQKKPSTLTLKENYREKALQKNYHFTLQQGKFRGQIMHATRVIREMQENHELGPLETLVLGQAYMAVIIMASNLKEEGRIQLDINCDGPLGGLSVEADNHGSVRGYIKQNPIALQSELKSLDDLSPLFGNGIMKVTRLENKSKNPYSSTINLKHGNLGKDLASYYLESEQIPSLVNLSIHFGRDGKILAAGALFLQVLPGASDEELDKLEKAAAKLPALGENLANGTQPQEYLEAFLGDFNPNVLKKTPLEFFCPCNKERIGKFLQQLPQKDRKDVLKGEFPMVLHCHNCNSHYEFSKGEVDELFQK